jgi:hypothetical protein
MLCVSFEIIGVSDLMFGKNVTEKKRDDETHEQKEFRTWQQKVHLTTDGQCFIQPFALKNCLESAARWLSMSIPGEGKKTFTKRFTSGVLVTEKMLLVDSKGKPLTIDDVEPIEIFAPSDGQRGSKKRVVRIFPTIHEWRSKGEAYLFDSKITEDVFRRHITAAGKFVGFGSMRVENGGINGRFAVENLSSKEIEM